VPPLYLANGEIIKDMEIESQDIQNELLRKIQRIEEIHFDILKFAPSSISRQLEMKFGKQTLISSRPTVLTISYLEPFSLYYLNLIRKEDKKRFYLTKNIIERVDWIFSQYNEILQFIGNQSLHYQFFDLDVAVQPNSKFTFYLFFAILLFCLGYKYGFLKY
jgi:hypothetical protein